jgi:hypothetical protein
MGELSLLLTVYYTKTIQPEGINSRGVLVVVRLKIYFFKSFLGSSLVKFA